MIRIAFAILLVFPATSAASGIEWQVKDNYRLLKNSEDQEWIKNIAQQSLDMNNSDINISKLRDKWDKVPDTYFDSATGTYEANYAAIDSWNIILSVSGSSNEEVCTWVYKKKEYTESCKEFDLPVLFQNDEENLIEVRYRDSVLSSEINIKDILIVGLGDSYASGEGNPDVFNTFFRESDWWDKKCHRSLYSWQILSSALLAKDNPHNSVTFISRACSGALIRELYMSRSKGVEPDIEVNGSKYIAHQLDSLSLDLCLRKEGDVCKGEVRQPDLILLSIGGNDAKFAKIITKALLGKINDGDGIDLKDKYRDYAVSGVKYLRDEYPKLAQSIYRRFPDSRVIMTVYPDPLHRHSRAFCGLRNAEGKKYLKLKSDGIIGFFSYLFGKSERNEEITALYDDFVTRLTGGNPPKDEDYSGLHQIGLKLEEKYAGKWNTVITRKGFTTYNQVPGYQPHGYCVPGDDVSGRWFLTIDDSQCRIGGFSGTMHPNIFGHMYYTSKVYPEIMSQ